MKKVLNIFVLLFVNIFFTNFYFLRFEKSDYSIAIKGLNNFSEDLSDIGFQSSQISYFGFAVFIGFLLTFFLLLFIKIDGIFSDVKILLFLPFNLFILNTGVLFSILYIFRFFNFPRSEILFNLFSYPVLMTLVYMFLNLDLKSYISKKLATRVLTFSSILFFVLFGYLIIFQNQQSRLIANTKASVETNESSIEFIITEDDISGDVSCAKWSGSDNFGRCISGAKLSKIAEYKSTITNIYKKDEIFFILFRNGVVIDKENNIFLDISEKVSNISSESGFYDLELHPTEDYFIVSYANLSNSLIVEKYSSKEKILIEKILEVPNPNDVHYCGSLEWSNYFNDFLLCVGDMGVKNSSLDTTSLKGKILLLNSIKSGKLPLVSESKLGNSLLNVVAYGLRNPWNFKEFDNHLYIPDVGEISNEELNIVNYNEYDKNSELLFGWPIFEGSIKNPETNYGLVNWDEDVSIYEYVTRESISPIVFYDRPAPENTRAAILGTLKYKNIDSEFNESIIFADYISKEIFLYDSVNNLINILTLPPFPGYLTAIGEHPEDVDKILISTSDGEGTSLYEITIP